MQQTLHLNRRLPANSKNRGCLRFKCSSSRDLKPADRLPIHELSAVNGRCLRFKCSPTAGMASPVEDEYAEYFSGSGAITCRVLYQLGPMVYYQFRTQDWVAFGYRDFGNYTRVALFSEHLRPADPQSPGVVGFAQALAREVAAQQQHLANCRHHGAPSENGTRDGQVPVHKALRLLVGRRCLLQRPAR